MHSVAPKTVLELYRTHISPDVQPADLVGKDGTYNKYNQWNTKLGCMHLQQPADTAGAAVSICGSSTVQLTDWLGRRYAGKQQLMQAKDGNYPGAVSPMRGSDPSITQGLYEICAPGQGAKVTLTDPIGVYMDDVDVSGWAAPDGTPLKREAVVALVRGTPGAAMRYSVRAPEGCGYVLGDCTVGGRPIEYGGQVVKNSITAYLRVSTYRAPTSPPPVQLAPPPTDGAAATPPEQARVTAVGVPVEAAESQPPSNCPFHKAAEKRALLEGEVGTERDDAEGPEKATPAWRRYLCGC